MFSHAAFRYVDVVIGPVAAAPLAHVGLGVTLAPGEAVAPGIVLLIGGAGVLLASPDREFIDVNMFPGIGKTTLWAHDIPAWLITRGFVGDPAVGRALRMMWGSRVMKVSKHLVLRPAALTRAPPAVLGQGAEPGGRVRHGSRVRPLQARLLDR